MVAGGVTRERGEKELPRTGMHTPAKMDRQERCSRSKEEEGWVVKDVGIFMKWRDADHDAIRFTLPCLALGLLLLSFPDKTIGLSLFPAVENTQSEDLGEGEGVPHPAIACMMCLSGI
jgi:hypothetical protein